jgi:hypothetical protein
MTPAAGGVWRKPWDELLQAQWLGTFCDIALSKPFVDTVTWRDLSDHAPHYLPGGGLLRSDLSPKPGLERLASLRVNLNRATGPAARRQKKSPLSR